MKNILTDFDKDLDCSSVGLSSLASGGFSLLSARMAESAVRLVNSRALPRWPSYASVSDASARLKFSSGLPANHLCCSTIAAESAPKKARA
jgi:hypothetical protein